MQLGYKSALLHSTDAVLWWDQPGIPNSLLSGFLMCLNYIYSQSSLAMQTSLVILFTFLLFNSSAFGFGFGSSQRSSCRSDSQCSGFRRSRCQGASFILCFGRTQRYNVGGRCVQKSNFLCGIGRLFGGIIYQTLMKTWTIPLPRPSELQLQSMCRVLERFWLWIQSSKKIVRIMRYL